MATIYYTIVLAYILSSGRYYTRADDVLRINFGVRFEQSASSTRIRSGVVRHVFHVDLPDIPTNDSYRPLPVCRLLRQRVADETCEHVKAVAPSLSDVNMDMLSKIRETLTLIYQLLPEAKVVGWSRDKRGLLDVGGKLLKFLVGTMDNDDLKLINHHLNSLKRKIDHVSAESARMGTFMRVTNQKLETVSKALDEQGDLLMSFVNDTVLLASEITITRAMLFTVHNRTVQYVSVLDHLNELRSAVELLKNGFISPALISHQDMADALTSAAAHLHSFCPTCHTSQMTLVIISERLIFHSLVPVSHYWFCLKFHFRRPRFGIIYSIFILGQCQCRILLFPHECKS